MRIITILSLVFFIQCSSNKKTIDNKTIDDRILEINKNYMFCLCMLKLNIDYEPDQKIKDGSIEMYFINDSLTIDIEKGQKFTENYLDSLNRNNIYRSYNNNSLAIAKCLDLYNSKELKEFIIK